MSTRWRGLSIASAPFIALAIGLSPVAAAGWSHHVLVGPLGTDQFVSTFNAHGSPEFVTTEEGLAFNGFDNIIRPAKNDRRTFFEAGIEASGSTSSPEIRVAWVDEVDRDALWISRNDTGSWVNSRLWKGTPKNPSLASHDRGIAVAFVDKNANLRYLTWDPVYGPTHPQVVASGCCTGSPALAMHHGSPVIAYAETGSGRLRLAKWSHGNWHLTTVAATGSSDPSIAWGAAGAVIAYRGSGDIRYAHHSSSGWRTDEVLSLGDHPEIAADSTGRVVVVADDHHSKILFRRIDVASAIQTVASAHGSWIRDSNPFVELVDGKARVVYAEGTPGAGGPGSIRWAIAEADQQ